MESHSFSEPQLVVGGETGQTKSMGKGDAKTTTDSDKGTEPTVGLTWRVHVMRNGVAEPIDSIDVNSETLPPRKNRSGKVVWRLPDDPHQVPKFGIHEQKRLWELFKEQKKQRRKQQKEQVANSLADATGNESTADASVAGGDDVMTTPENASLETNGASRRKADRVDIAPPETPVAPQQPIESPRSRNLQRNTSGQPAVLGTPPLPPGAPSHPQVTPPPPGFGTSAPALESLTIRESPPGAVPRNLPLSEDYLHYQGDSLSPSPTTHVVPSSPGLGGIAQPRSSPFITHSIKASIADSLSSSPASVPVAPGSIANDHNGNHNPPELFTRQRLSHPPLFGSAFTVAPPDERSLPQLLAAEVARAFLRLVAAEPCVRMPDGFGGDNGAATPAAAAVAVPDEWLAFYFSHARSTLVMGTAQAVASTLEERYRQWQNLAASSSSRSRASLPPTDAGYAKWWDCNGWTAQPIDDDPDLETEGRCRQVLVVLTGRTMQQHLLSFHLSLVLQQVSPQERLSGAQQQPHLQKPLDADRPTPLLLPSFSYRISNEVLAFALLA